MKKIVFIEPESPGFHIFSRIPLPRLGTMLLGSILEREGYEVESYVETVGGIDLKRVMEADAVGISTITSTTPRGYDIANGIREMGIPVFMGGVHVTYLPEEALNYCDYVLRGEADETIVDFIRALEQGKGFESVPGLSYRMNGDIVHNSDVSYCKDMDSLPCPDFSMISGLKKLGTTPIMTSRGCPYDCSFCSVTGMFGRQYRFRNKDKVLEELSSHKDRVRREGWDNWVFFYDDNFTANKKRTKELLKAMIQEGLTPKWTAQVRVDVAKDMELLELMKEANCHTVYIGLESINPDTLRDYNKQQTVQDIEESISTLHRYGIGVHGMFVFGSDKDNRDTIRQTVGFAKKNDIESVQFMILTPLPGTGFYKEMDNQDRIVSKDWSLYDAHHVVFEPTQMTCFELQNETVKATAKFYSLWQIIKRLFRFDFFTVIIKSYGRNLTRKWIRKNGYFLEHLWDITQSAGQRIELAAKKTSDDIKNRLKALKVHKLKEDILAKTVEGTSKEVLRTFGASAIKSVKDGGND
ncbi:MAG: B12-binding domain-containing radical SAM protein [Thermodesulfobacteriota bacterium]